MKTFSFRKRHFWRQLRTQVSVGALAALWMATLTAFGQGALHEPLTPLRIQWQTNFGGVAIEGGLMKVMGLRSGQYVMGGDSYSPAGGNKTAPRRSTSRCDAWVVKFDEEGRKLWDVSLGGTNLRLSKPMRPKVHWSFEKGGGMI